MTGTTPTPPEHQRAAAARILRPRASRLLGLVLVLSMLVTGVAMADTLEGDELTDIREQGQLALGEVCVGQDATGTVNLAILRAATANNNTNNNVYKDGTTVTVAATGATSGLTAGAPATSILLPSNWQSQPANGTTFSDSVTATVTLNTATSGAFSGSVTYQSSGVNNAGTIRTRSDVIPVTATVVSCETNSAPELTLSDGMTVEGNTLGGADVTYTGISATDAEDEDESLTIVCDPADGSFFALGGPHSVECSVTDSGGLSDSGTFEVTVVDTTAPILSGVPGDQSATFSTADGGAVISWISPTAEDIVDGDITPTCESDGGLGNGDVFPIGATQVTCSATDASGNAADTGAFDVNVTYAATGVLQPINADGTSTFKLNSTVPVKMKMTGTSAGYAGGNLTISLARLGTAAGPDVNETVTSTSAHSGNTLRYDATSDQYIFNLGTKGLSAGTYRLTVTLDDGTTRTVQFGLRK